MKILRIEGRRWFNKRHGNTYFSAVAYADGKQVAEIDYEYGYGDQYLQSMFRVLEKEGIVTDLETYSNHCKEMPWRWAQRNGVELLYNVTDVPRKKDL